MNQGHLARLRRLRENSHEKDLFFITFQLSQFTCVAERAKMITNRTLLFSK